MTFMSINDKKFATKHEKKNRLKITLYSDVGFIDLQFIIKKISTVLSLKK